MRTTIQLIAAVYLGTHDKTLRLAVALLFLASLSLTSRLSGQTTRASDAAAASAARLTILGDNSEAQSGVKAVWGFACLVEAHGHTVLFDTGADPAALKHNLAAMKVGPSKIEAVVISHYHPDHTWGAPGLGTLSGVRVFIPRRFEGRPMTTAALRSAGLALVPVSQTTALFDGITVTEPLHFEGRISMGTTDQGSTDELWEQCLTVDTPVGLVVIVGCSHPGILSMLEQIRRQSGRPLYLVIGGFHLLGQSDTEVHQIATAMQGKGVAYVSATHCTGEAAARVFRDVFRDRYVSAGVGAVIDLPFVTTATGSAPQPGQPPKPSSDHQKLALGFGAQTTAAGEGPAARVYPMQEGFADANGVLIYYKAIGRGAPLVILHGGPGGTHDGFLPYLLPLARRNRLVFIDERGSGKSERLEDASAYTVENMVEDVEVVRNALNLGNIALLGHSFGGVVAQAYAFKYQQNLTHLILCSTFHGTTKMNEVFHRMKENMTPELRQRVEGMEQVGLFGHGKDYEKRRYTSEYMIAAWGEGYFPYLFQNRPDANFDPTASTNFAWDVYREMWGSHGEFLIDGNLRSVEYSERLCSIRVPTLIAVGDHDECAPSLSEEMNKAIPDSKLVVFPKSGHMTFVDQPNMFNRVVNDFLHQN